MRGPFFFCQPCCIAAKNRLHKDFLQVSCENRGSLPFMPGRHGARPWLDHRRNLVKKSLVAIAIACGLNCGPALSQSTPALDPVAVEAAKQLLKAIKARELMIASVQQIEQRMPEQIRTTFSGTIQNDANMSAQQKQEAKARFEKTIPSLVAQVHAVLADPAVIDEVMAEMVPLYAQTYTVDEIRQLTALYQTPLGQKILASTPKIAAQSMDISNRVMMPRLQKLMAQMAGSLTGN
jgi:hypothetical protein